MAKGSHNGKGRFKFERAEARHPRFRVYKVYDDGELIGTVERDYAFWQFRYMGKLSTYPSDTRLGAARDLATCYWDHEPDT